MRLPTLGSAIGPRPMLPTSLSCPSYPSPSTAPSLVLLSPASPGVGEAEGIVGGGDVVVVPGALRTRLPLLFLAQEVRPGHPSAPHG